MSFKKIFIMRKFLNSLIFSEIFFANKINSHMSSAGDQENIYIPKVVSYRTALCSFCKKWFKHLRNNGLEVIYNIVENVSVIKSQYQIPNNLRSCRSAQIANYTIERYVTFESINKLLRKGPSTVGKPVPGRLLGSPRLEMHNHNSHTLDNENYYFFSCKKKAKQKYLIKSLLNTNTKV